MSSFPHRPHRGKSDDYLTPPEIVQAVGPFDLDPCASSFQGWRPWETARESWTWGGLERPWFGFVWLNPPFSNAEPWLRQLGDHEPGGIALLLARLETDTWFKRVWSKYAGLFVLRGRPNFYYPWGERCPFNSGAPVVLVGYRDQALRRLATCKLDGHLVLAAGIVVRGDGTPCATWREVVREAMAGRPMRVRDIYQAVETSPKVQAAKAQGVKWREKIRKALQAHFEPVEYGVWAPAGA